MFSFVLWILPALAISINRTIDDTYGDSVTGLKPQYGPPSSWTESSQCGILCDILSLDIDVEKIYNGTWHESMYDTGDQTSWVSVKFNGTAVYVFNIIVDTDVDLEESILGFTTDTNVVFFLDDAPVGQYTHIPDNSDEVLYQVPVYTNTSLHNGEHTLVMHTGRDTDSLALFDYIIYTFEDSSGPYSSSSSLAPTAASGHTSPLASISPTSFFIPNATFSSTSSIIAGPAVTSSSHGSQVQGGRPLLSRLSPGAIAGIVIVCVFTTFILATLLFHLRRRSIRARRNPPLCEPFVDPASKTSPRSSVSLAPSSQTTLHPCPPVPSARPLAQALRSVSRDAPSSRLRVQSTSDVPSRLWSAYAAPSLTLIDRDSESGTRDGGRALPARALGNEKPREEIAVREAERWREVARQRRAHPRGPRASVRAQGAVMSDHAGAGCEVTKDGTAKEEAAATVGEVQPGMDVGIGVAV